MKNEDEPREVAWLVVKGDSRERYSIQFNRVDGAKCGLERINCGVGIEQRASKKLAFYPAAFTISKMGRYMAMTIPPTTTPRNTIITGSINASSPDTAASTSSS
jgi:hypothetical protein